MVQTLLGLAQPLRPADAADAAALALCHLAHAPMRGGGVAPDGGGPMIGSLRGTLLDRGARRGHSSRSPASATASRSAPTTAVVARRGRRRGVPAGSTTTSARTPQTLYGFATSDERHVLRGAARRPRRRPRAGPRHPRPSTRRSRWPRVARRRRPRRALPRARASGKKTAARLLVELKSPPRRPRPRRRVAAPGAGGAAPPRPAGARADVRDALAGLG